MVKSGKQKIEDFFREHVGEWISGVKIAEISGIHGWARTIRKLRNTEGWDFEQRKLGQRRTEYRLRTREKKESHEREPISKKLRVKVLRRDNFRCVYCGKSPEEDGVKLQIDHKIPVSWGGKTKMENLQTLCEDCNLGKKNFYANYEDNDLIKEILKQTTGKARLKLIGTKITKKPLKPELIGTLAGIRDWPRTLRLLRDEGAIDYEYDHKNETYTFFNPNDND